MTSTTTKPFTATEIVCWLRTFVAAHLDARADARSAVVNAIADRPHNVLHEATRLVRVETISHAYERLTRVLDDARFDTDEQRVAAVLDIALELAQFDNEPGARIVWARAAQIAAGK